MQSKCAGQKADGSPCNGVPWRGTRFCWYHAEEAAGDRARGRKLGGAARSNANRARKELLQGALSPAELEGVIGMTITQVLSGKKSPGIGQAIAALARASVAIRESASFEQQLDELRAQVAELSTRKGVA